MRRSIFRGVAAAMFAAMFAAPSLSQTWPARPIKWVVPYAAATAPDAMARVMADAMGDILKQPIVIENKPGAAGNLGAQLVSHAPPDGYTWIFSAAPMAGNMRMYKSPGYDALKDFVHVSAIGSLDSILIVNADSRIDSVKTLVNSLRQDPGKMTYGSGGNGTPSHLGVALLLNITKTEAVHVPYKGASAAVLALLSKEIDLALPIFSVALPQVQAGKVRPLAVSGLRRNPRLPDVPTLVEVGFPDLTILSFSGVSVPANTPAAIVGRVNDAVRQALDRPAVKAKLEAMGVVDVGASTPDKFTEAFRSEMALTERMMRAANLEMQ